MGCSASRSIPIIQSRPGPESQIDRDTAVVMVNALRHRYEQIQLSDMSSVVSYHFAGQALQRLTDSCRSNPLSIVLQDIDVCRQMIEGLERS